MDTLYKNSKWITDLNVKLKFVIPLRKNIGKKSLDLRLRKEF